MEYNKATAPEGNQSRTEMRSGYLAVERSRRWILYGAQVPLLVSVVVAIDPLIVAGDYVRAGAIVAGAIVSVILLVRLVYAEAILKRTYEQELRQAERP